MSEHTPLEVTLELPASEFMEHEGAPLVRCPINGVWVPLTDYYSEGEGTLLPLVGNVDYVEAPEHWVEVNGQMEKVVKDVPVVWQEVVRILPKPPEAPPEGGSLAFNVLDDVGTKDHLI